MEFGDYLRRVKEVENSIRTDAAKKADIKELQGHWQQEVKKKHPEQKRNDLSSIRKAVDNRLEMNKEILANKWKE